MIIAFGTCFSLILTLAMLATGASRVELRWEKRRGLAAQLPDPVQAGPPVWVLTYCETHHWTEPHRDSDGFWRAFPMGGVIPMLVRLPRKSLAAGHRGR